MPTTDDLKARANARALRKAARDGNVEAAQTEAVKLAQVSEKQAAEKAPAEPASVNTAQAPRGVIKQQNTRANVTKAGRKAAERQAQVDAERAPEPVNVEAEAERWNGMGNPPLHLLNAAAERIDAEVRNEGKEVAAAAAKGAYEVYVGKVVGKRNRHARMRAQQAAGEAILAKQSENG